MNETMHCAGILGKASYSLQKQFKSFFRCNNFLLSYGHFLSKNSFKMHIQRPNTMKETLQCRGILGLLIVFRTSLTYFPMPNNSLLSYMGHIAYKCIPRVS